MAVGHLNLRVPTNHVSKFATGSGGGRAVWGTATSPFSISYLSGIKDMKP